MFDLMNIYDMYTEKKPQVFAMKCPKCGALYHPAPMICPKCLNRRDPSNYFFPDWEKVPMEGECTLLTWTRVYALPEGYEMPFLLFGVVAYPNGLRASGQLQVDEPKIGMKLTTDVGEVKRIGSKVINGLIFKQV